MSEIKKDIQKILDMNAEIVQMNASILKQILNPPMFMVPADTVISKTVVK